MDTIQHWKPDMFAIIEGQIHGGTDTKMERKANDIFFPFVFLIYFLSPLHAHTHTLLPYPSPTHNSYTERYTVLDMKSSD